MPSQARTKLKVCLFCYCCSCRSFTFYSIFYLMLLCFFPVLVSNKHFSVLWHSLFLFFLSLFLSLVWSLFYRGWYMCVCAISEFGYPYNILLVVGYATILLPLLGWYWLVCCCCCCCSFILVVRRCFSCAFFSHSTNRTEKNEQKKESRGQKMREKNTEKAMEKNCVAELKHIFILRTNKNSKNSFGHPEQYAICIAARTHGVQLEVKSRARMCERKLQ